jgi:hypothetical protein
MKILPEHISAAKEYAGRMGSPEDLVELFAARAMAKVAEKTLGFALKMGGIDRALLVHLMRATTAADDRMIAALQRVRPVSEALTSYVEDLADDDEEAL